MLLPDVTFESGAPSISFEVREVRRAAIKGRNDFFVSSSLSEGLREPSGIFFIGDPPRTGSDMADGSSVGRCFPGANCVALPNEFIGACCCGLGRSKLLLLCIASGLLVSSVLLPAPRMTTGASLSRKKSSISALVVLVTLLLRLDGVRSKLSAVVPALADRPILSPLAELPLRPLKAYLP